MWFSRSKIMLSKIYVAIILSVLVIASFIVLNSSSQAVSESNNFIKKNNHFFSDGTNDVAIFTPSHSTHAWDYVDGGLGIDTLWLQLTQQEAEHPAVRADILRFYYFLMHNSQPMRLSGEGPEFNFKAFELNLRNFENIIIEKIEANESSSKRLGEKPLTMDDVYMIHDSSFDSLG